MFIYHDELGNITQTMTISLEGFLPPPGDYISWDGPEPNPVSDYMVSNGALVRREFVSEAQREAAQERITSIRGQMRAKFITVLPGQDMVYLEKRSEAIAFLNYENPTPALFPVVYSEVGITAPTAYEVAQTWLNMNDMWRQVSTIIEAATLEASGVVAIATTNAEIEAALAKMNMVLAVLGVD